MNKIDLFDLGLCERYIREAALYDDSLCLARVSVQYNDVYKVITENGEIQARTSGRLNYAASISGEYPVVGDWVLVDRTDDKSGDAVIKHILTRKSCFARKAAGTELKQQKIAANIDTVFICMALNNDYNLRRVERYLSIAWDSMATPVIVLTKADLCNDLEIKLRYLGPVALGVDWVVTSSLSAAGWTDILGYLSPGKTAAFIGSSGVGKSTLINQLMGEKVMATGGLRVNDKGRHTTTQRQLLVLPTGGVVIDTPGMRELQVAGADLTKSFADIEELGENCYFGDCRHESEPRCAVKQAVQDGVLSAERLANYKKLQREMAFDDRKHRMSAAQAEKHKVIEMMGSLDAYKKVKKITRRTRTINS